MNLLEVPSVYCIGLGGVGVSGVAKFLLATGVQVAGSDPDTSPITKDVEALGAVHFTTIDPARVAAYAAVIHTDACPADHPEMEAARQAGIPIFSFAEALGQIFNSFEQRVAISGTNGKSTTSALTGILCAAAGLDPTVFVGSRVAQFNGNLLLGQGPTMIAEADEYRNHFHHLRPTILTVTNIEIDHFDFFPNLAAIQKSFRTEAEQLGTGTLVANADSPVVRDLFRDHPNVVWFGERGQQLMLRNIRALPGAQSFDVDWMGQRLGSYTLHIPGKMNIQNAAAAMTTALVAGAEPRTFDQVLKDFRGVWRRFEILNPGASTTVINDYAHHPSALRGTLEGAKAFYPGRRIIAVFQPHQQSRLDHLFDEFLTAFQAADSVILTDVYAVLGRHEAAEHSSRELASRLEGQHQEVRYAPTLHNVLEATRSIAKPGDVILLMGAGDIWKIGNELSEQYV